MVDQQRDDAPKVVVLALGGTIASGVNPDGSGVSSRLGAQQLVDMALAAGKPLTLNGQPISVVAKQFRQSSSTNLQLADAVELSAAIRAEIEAGAAGVVVTQGTDTMEETSFAVDLLTDTQRAGVVFTGAMRNPTLPGADGPANLSAAILVAADPAARDKGVLVVFADEIHSARFVRKAHSTAPGAFKSAPVGPIGWLTERRVTFAVTPVPYGARLSLSSGVGIPAVALLRISIGDDARLVEQIANLGYAGCVIESMGGGHVPEQLAEAVTKLAAEMPVVLASRAGVGEQLAETYGFVGSEQYLLGHGLIPAGMYDGIKARVTLSLILAEPNEDGQITSSREFVQLTGRRFKQFHWAG